MKRSDYIKSESESNVTCDDYGKCFECYHKKRCIYKRDKDFEQLFGVIGK